MQADEDRTDPTLADLALAVQRETMIKIWGSLPARVTAYYPPGDDAVGEGRQPARVDLLVSLQRKRVMDNAADLLPGEVLEDPIGDEVADRFIAVSDYPPILRAVVMRASCGDDTMRLRGAVSVGTSGAAHFSARSLDRWATRSGQVDPVFTHAHNLSDCVFFPEVREGPAEVDDPPAAGLWSDDETCGLTFDPGVAGTAALIGPNVDIGTSPTHHVARSEAVDANLTALKAAIAAIPPTGDPSAEIALTALKLAVSNWSTPTTSSSKIRVPAA